jgi:Winged helix DNA-binding domain
VWHFPLCVNSRVYYDMLISMAPRDIANDRLANQQIASAIHKKPSDVVASLVAIQAQDYLSALWAIGLRLPNATELDIKQAIADRTIIRTWPMRGTLHFVAAADVRWMLELLTPRIIAGNAGRCRQLELDTAIFAQSRKLFLNALQGDNQLPRDEMYQLLERSRISTANQRGLHILWRLAQEGVLCFASHAGKQPTFALLDEWGPKTKKLDHDEALSELARRYFTSHGPATLQDFVWWSGLKISDAKTGLEATSSKLAQETIDGKVYWMPQNGLDDIPNTVHLLPGFDEYLLGYKDRSASLDPRHAPKVIPGKNGIFMPTIVRSGRVVGTWKRALKKNAVVVTTSFFGTPKKIETCACEDAAKRYGRFLGIPVESQSVRVLPDT